MGNETIINSGTSGFSQKLKTRINNVAGTRITRFTSGDVIDGRYRVISRISQTTGEADIYKVTDLQSSDAVMVLKLFRRKDAIKDEVLHRLLSLDSPYVAAFRASGRISGLTYIIMPFYGKGSLASFIEQGIRFTAEEIKTFILPSVLEGLKAIHDLGIIHKDLKPGNMMISDDESHIVLIDFGISSVADSSTMVVTQTGKSPFYSAPETTTGLFWTGSDYYSLGISLYELYTGTTPYQNAGIENVAIYAQAQRIPFPDDFDAGLKDLIEGLTYKDISNRNDGDNPNRRWGYQEVNAWINGEKPPVPGHTTVTTGKILPYIFNNRKYFSLKELIEDFLDKWEDGKKEVFRGFLSRYFAITGNSTAHALTMEAEHDFNDHPEYADAIYFKLMYTISPEPINGIYWHGVKYESLEEYARNVREAALNNNLTLCASVYELFRDKAIYSYKGESTEQAELLLKIFEKINAGIERYVNEATPPDSIQLSLIFTNTVFNESRIYYPGKFFDSFEDYQNYFLNLKSSDTLDYIRFCHHNYQDLKNTALSLSIENFQKLKEIMPVLYTDPEKDELHMVYFDNYVFRNLREAYDYNNRLLINRQKTDSSEADVNEYKNFNTLYREYQSRLQSNHQSNLQKGIQSNRVSSSEKSTSASSCMYIQGCMDVGEQVTFGVNRENLQPMKWVVLDVDHNKGRALLLSLYAIGENSFSQSKRSLFNRILMYAVIFSPVCSFFALMIICITVILFNIPFEQGLTILRWTMRVLFFIEYLIDYLLNLITDAVAAMLFAIAAHFVAAWEAWRRLRTDSVPLSTGSEKATWKNSFLRGWLNNVFLQDTFAEAEQKLILTHNVNEPGLFNSTADKVFLLSEDEVREYLNPASNENLAAYLNCGIDEAHQDYSVSWWLRSPLKRMGRVDLAATVDGNGEIKMRGSSVTGVYVRPAVWVNI